MELKGKVKRVIYSNPETNYYVFTMEDASDNNQVKKAKGNFLLEVPYPGQEVVLRGEWEDTKYGPTFSASSFTPGALDTQEGIRKYLVSYVKGIGEVTAKRLVDYFGTDTFEILSNFPERLEEVPNLNKIQRDSLTLQWSAYNEYREIAVHLLNLNLPNTVVKRIYDTWGSEAIRRIDENPYSLMEIKGVGFVMADVVALSMGVQPDSAFRIGACIEYTLRSASSGPGHLYMQAPQLISQVYSLIQREGITEFGRRLTTDDVKAALRDLKSRERIVVDDGAIYLSDLHYYEKESAKLLASFVGEHDRFRVDIEEFISSYEESNNIEFSEEQREAIRLLKDHKVLLITGLPGTGKCVVPETMVSGPWGFAPIGDFLPEKTDADTCHHLEMDLDTSKGIRRSAYLYDGGISDTVKITSKFGFSLEGTPEHPVRVIRDAQQVWVKLGDIQKGDVLVLCRGENYSFGSDDQCLLNMPEKDWHFNTKKYVVPNQMSPDLARLFGYIVSEGYVVPHSGWSISGHDERVLSFLEGVFSEYFEYNPSRTFDRRYSKDVDLRVASTFLVEWFRLQGIDAVLSGEQKVPRAILRASRESVIGFLQALFEGDGAVSKDRCTVEYSTKSETLAHQVQTLLLALGIVASRAQRGNGHWRLSISGEDYSRFRDIVGFQFKTMPLRECASNTNMHLLHGVAPLIKKLKDEVRPAKGKEYNFFYRSATGRRTPSRSHLKKLMSFGGTQETRRLLESYASPSLFYDVVGQVEHGKSQVLDFHVPDVHEFLSNGFISHNTTLTRALVNMFKFQGLSFQLLSPTGIAAKRLSNAAGAPAATIHRALGYKGDSWLYNESNKFPADAIIVDEASMIDQQVMYRLLSALKDDVILVFVGDSAQLPSVGAGNVLHELMRSGRIAQSQLTQIFRQEEASDIILNAHRINAGLDPVLGNPTAPTTDFKFISRSSSSEIIDGILKVVQSIQRKSDNDTTFQVLSPRWKGDLGVTNLNNEIREVLNPMEGQRERGFKGGMRLREGDRVIITANDYEKGVFNGEVGTITEIDTRNSEVNVRIRDERSAKLISIPFSEVPDMMNLAFCVTIHKSQGLQWDYIIMPFVKSYYIQLQRNLLYTAVTRAAKKVFIFGEWEAVQKAVDNNEVVNRNTVLAERINTELDNK